MAAQETRVGQGWLGWEEEEVNLRQATNAAVLVDPVLAASGARVTQHVVLARGLGAWQQGRACWWGRMPAPCHPSATSLSPPTRDVEALVLPGGTDQHPCPSLQSHLGPAHP